MSDVNGVASSDKPTMKSPNSKVPLSYRGSVLVFFNLFCFPICNSALINLYSSVRRQAFSVKNL